MSFLPHAFYNHDNTSFTPLFRLLDDYDDYSRRSGGNAKGNGYRSILPQWQPKFDVRETGETYELYGELPGMSKEDVHIEFTEAQAILIRGKSERTYTAGTPPNHVFEDASKARTLPEGDKERRNSHQATVEDESEAKAHEATSTEVEPAAKKPVDKAKYWLTERTIGEFSRTFNFPTPVDHDAVNASFKDGILSIVVPKAKKREARRIAIN